MAKVLDPKLFNIDVLALTDENVKQFKEVTTGAIFETNSDVFRKGSLYDTEIFGPIGSQIRNEQFGYINLHVPILHPFVYETLLDLGSLFSKIVEGKQYVKFDNTINNFVPCERQEGNTGYGYLMDNIHKVKFQDNNSDQRRYKIQLVEKYCKKEFMSTKLLVLPAGLREYSVDAKGIPSEDEINNLYRKVLGVSTMLKNTNIDLNSYIIDPIRLKIQKSVNEVFNYIFMLLKGKSKFIEGNFTKRAISYGTRNVITPFHNEIQDLTKQEDVLFNKTIVGLYQYVKAISPITMNRVLSIFINRILNPNNNSAYLVDKGSLRYVLAEIQEKKKNEWLSMEGLTSIMNKLNQDGIRISPIELDNHYLLLVYDDGVNVKILFNNEEILPDMKKEYIRPITYCELFYLAIYDVRNKYPAFMTRYPVIDLGGIYPTGLYVKTTVKGRTINLTINNEEKEVTEYPILNQKFVESLSPHTSKLGRLGADFDGDTCSLNVLFTQESINELNKYLNSKEAYVTPTGDITYSSATDVVELVMAEITD